MIRNQNVSSNNRCLINQYSTMKNFESTRKPSRKGEEAEMKKIPKKKDYNGPKRIRTTSRILREEEDLETELS